MHGDHLGSTSLTTCGENCGIQPGAIVSEARYLPYGQERWTGGETPTDFGFTSQSNDSYIKLIDYGARRYDPELGRFVSPDSIVPDEENPQHWNRYSYVYDNPLKFVDSMGHRGGPIGASDGDLEKSSVEQVCEGGGGAGGSGKSGGSDLLQIL